MLATTNTLVDRDCLRLLRQAKQLVKQEFDQVLLFQHDDVVDHLYRYAIQSTNEELFNIYYQLTRKAAQSTDASSPVKRHKRIEIGDVINGRRCVAIYRGEAVFDS